MNQSRVCVRVMVRALVTDLARRLKIFGAQKFHERLEPAHQLLGPLLQGTHLPAPIRMPRMSPSSLM